MIIPDNFISVGTQDKPVVDYLNKLFASAMKRKVSDIHFLTQGKDCFIQFRDSGIMVDIDMVDHSMADQIDSKIRARADLNKADMHIPVDGRMSLRYSTKDDNSNQKLDVRVSITPTVGGRKIVCRLLDETNSARTLAEITMSIMVRRSIEDIIAQPNGLFLVSGPTGSGKTTLLYAILNDINDGTKNICTIENPVEYSVPKITQINISQYITFALGLSTVLRQDPDIILIGEIRDAETARIAVEAANTGHLVLATIHANSAALSITRMIDLGVNPQSLAGCLRAVTAQRLLRAVGDDSGVKWRTKTAVESEWLKCHQIDIGPDTTLLPHDDGRTSLFRGRMPILEMIKNDAGVSRAIVEGQGEIAILNAAVNQPQLELLAQAGVRLALQGRTTMERVVEAVGREAMTPTVMSQGKELVKQGLISSDELYTVLEIQANMRSKGFVRSLEDLAKDFAKRRKTATGPVMARKAAMPLENTGGDQLDNLPPEKNLSGPIAEQMHAS